jgi:hypothetical protein
MMAIKECYLELQKNNEKDPIGFIQKKGNIINKIYHLNLVLGGKKIDATEALQYEGVTYASSD